MVLQLGAQSTLPEDLAPSLAHMTGDSELPVTPVPGDPVPASAHARMHLHTPKETQTYPHVI